MSKKETEALVRSELKGLERSVELSINANSPIRLFAEYKTTGFIGAGITHLKEGKVTGAVVLYPETGKTIEALSISGIHYAAIMPGNNGWTFLYKSDKINHRMEIMMRHPAD